MFRGEKASVSKVVRVAVANNFNCTADEFRQVDGYQVAHPSYHYFVNCNIHTPNLESLNDHPYQAVITINPTFDDADKVVEKLYKVDRDKVAFVRVKYLPARPDINALAHELAEDHYKVVLTLQRFNGYKTLDEYTSREHYHHAFNRMRLTDKAMEDVDALAASHPNIYVCDRSGQGCKGCGLCASLTIGTADVDLASLNLSTSGICKFNCPDCYAKTMQKFLTACEYQPINFDVIKKNNKQRGATKHTLAAKEGH